jgi:drug/metabolite transporter (DMT)-like permease
MLPQKRKSLIGFSLVGLASALFGSLGYFGLEIMKSGLVVEEMLFWRFSISTIILLPFMCLEKFKPISLKTFSLIVFCVIVYSFGAWIYFLAVVEIGTGLSMVLFFIFPIIVCLLNWAVKGERSSTTTFISLFFVFIGIFLLASIHVYTVSSFGIMCALASGVGYGAYIFCSESLKISTTQTTFWVCTGSSLFFLILIAFGNSSLTLPRMPTDWVNAIMLSILCTLMPIFLLFRAMHYISTTHLSILSVIEPIATLLIGHYVLREFITGQQWIGIWIILISVVLLKIELLLKKTPQFG